MRPKITFSLRKGKKASLKQRSAKEMKHEVKSYRIAWVYNFVLKLYAIFLIK